jgi:hypothetical protein
MSESPKPLQPVALPLLQILANLDRGSIVQELQGELSKITKAVSLLEKAGKLTLVIDVAPVKNMPHGVFLQAEVSSKVPKPRRGADMLYTDATGGLHRSDPRQIDAFENMKPRIVGSGTVNVTTGEILTEGASA